MRFIPLFYTKPDPWYYNIPGILAIIVAGTMIATFVKACL